MNVSGVLLGDSRHESLDGLRSEVQYPSPMAMCANENEIQTLAARRPGDAAIAAPTGLEHQDYFPTSSVGPENTIDRAYSGACFFYCFEQGADLTEREIQPQRSPPPYHPQNHQQEPFSIKDRIAHSL